MSIYTKEDIIRITKEEKVNFINLQFTDILGTLKSVSVTTSQLEKALNNRCMFDGSSIDGFVRIEESDMCLHPDLDSFVILPMPKWDDNQEEYYTSISNSSSLLSMVPVSAKNKEFSSAVFDILSYEGQKEIIPAFFEHSMKLKFSRDNTASQLFDIIRAGTTVDFGMLYDGGTGMFTIMAKLIKDKSTNFASEFAAIKDKTLAHYQDIMNLMKK